MATQSAEANTVTETCSACDAVTTHRVRVEIRTESQREENAAFSREPYRVAICRGCGCESVTRMNDA